MPSHGAYEREDRVHEVDKTIGLTSVASHRVVNAPRAGDPGWS